MAHSSAKENYGRQGAIDSVKTLIKEGASNLTLHGYVDLDPESRGFVRDHAGDSRAYQSTEKDIA
jgi:hypothetical protein